MSNIEGVSNRRLAQYLAPASLIRTDGADPTGPFINVSATESHTIGFTSGIPAVFDPAAGTATSGITLPAKGTYWARAIVYASGVGGVNHDNGTQTPEMAIALTIDDTDIAQSVRTIPVASGLAFGNVVAPAFGLTKLETECLFETDIGDVTLAVRAVSNAHAGDWELVGGDKINAAHLNPATTPAAVLFVQRVPDLPLNNTNVHLTDDR